jgi:uncharacterized membrane protein YhaH (DUF805 family)
MSWYFTVLKKYVQFSGRARRAEFWWFNLVNLIASLVLSFVDAQVGTVFIGLLYSFAVFLPALGVFVRRLHDTDRSGWWLLLSFIPVIGVIVLIVFAAQEGSPGVNGYGPNPKAEPVRQTIAA